MQRSVPQHGGVATTVAQPLSAGPVGLVTRGRANGGGGEEALQLPQPATARAPRNDLCVAGVSRDTWIRENPSVWAASLPMAVKSTDVWEFPHACSRRAGASLLARGGRIHITGLKVACA